MLSSAVAQYFELIHISIRPYDAPNDALKHHPVPEGTIWLETMQLCSLKATCDFFFGRREDLRYLSTDVLIRTVTMP